MKAPIREVGHNIRRFECSRVADRTAKFDADTDIVAAEEGIHWVFADMVGVSAEGCVL